MHEEIIRSNTVYTLAATHITVAHLLVACYILFLLSTSVPKRASSSTLHLLVVSPGNPLLQERGAKQRGILPSGPHSSTRVSVGFVSYHLPQHPFHEDFPNRPRELERRTLRLTNQSSKIKGKIPLAFNHTNIVCRTGHLLGLILDKHLDRDTDILNFSTHSKDGTNEEASLRQRTMYDKSWGTDASVLSSRFSEFQPSQMGVERNAREDVRGRIFDFQ